MISNKLTIIKLKKKISSSFRFFLTLKPFYLLPLNRNLLHSFKMISQLFAKRNTLTNVFPFE